MKRQVTTQAQKETMPPQMIGLLPHTAVRSTVEHNMPSNSLLETRLHHDFSQVAVHPLKPIVSQAYSNASCSLFSQCFPMGGACHTCPPRVQAKLKVGTPGDKYEQEADRVAEQVMRMPEPQVQREGCSYCEKEGEELIQFKPTGYGYASAQTVNNSLIQNVLSSPGQPLHAAMRNFMEPRFGHDFSGVRIHMDGKASESASVVNARAYTVGQDVVFGAGEYSSDTFAGRKLLAHELTHVLQQERGKQHPLPSQIHFQNVQRADVPYLQRSEHKENKANPDTAAAPFELLKKVIIASQAKSVLEKAKRLRFQLSAHGYSEEKKTLDEAINEVESRLEEFDGLHLEYKKRQPRVLRIRKATTELKDLTGEEARRREISECQSAQDLLFRSALELGERVTRLQTMIGKYHKLIYEEEPLTEEKALKQKKWEQPSIISEVVPQTDKKKRRKKKCNKLMEWKEDSVNEVIASGGIPGALDWCFQTALPFTDPKLIMWHAHHPWPMYIGGTVDQPKMGVRHSLHIQFLHPTLLKYLQEEFPEITSQESTNEDLVAKLRIDKNLRQKLSLKLKKFYLNILNTLTDPGIPPEAYARGIRHTLASMMRKPRWR